MVALFYNLVKSARPRQSLKNLALLAPLVFSGNLLVREKFLTAAGAVVTFSFLTAAVYLFNDVADLPSDRLHPYKKRRPIAAGELPVPTALFVGILLVFLSLRLALEINFFFFWTLLVYLLIQFLYTLLLKKLVIIDVITVAMGFVLRVYAGAIAIDVHMSVWFLLGVVSLALFLAVGKRRAELTVLAKTTVIKRRRVLTHYTPEILDNYLAMFSTSAWLAWALFTFFEPAPPIYHRFPTLISFLADLPVTLVGTSKWLMVTIPIVIFGIMRYTKIIYEGEKAEAPERVLLSDKPLLGAVLFWGMLVVTIIYGLRV